MSPVIRMKIVVMKRMDELTPPALREWLDQEEYRRLTKLAKENKDGKRSGDR